MSPSLLEAMPGKPEATTVLAVVQDAAQSHDTILEQHRDGGSLEIEGHEISDGEQDWLRLDRCAAIDDPDGEGRLLGLR